MELLSTSEAAARLGVHRDTIHRWIVDGVLKALRVGPNWAIRPADLAGLVKRKPGRKPRKLQA